MPPDPLFIAYLRRQHAMIGAMIEDWDANVAVAELEHPVDPPWDGEDKPATIPTKVTPAEEEAEEPPAKPAPAKRASRAKPAPKPEPEPEPETPEVGELTFEEYSAQLKAMSLDELRELTISLGYDEDAVNGASQKDLIESILVEKFPGTTVGEAHEEAEETDDSGEDEGPDEDAAPADDSDVLTRAELAAMSKGALRKLCAQVELPKDQWESLDEKGLVDLLVSYQEAADEDEEAEPEVPEEPGDGWTEEDLKRLSRGELLVLARQFGVPDDEIPDNADSEQIIALIYATAPEE
jgi:hypothetical protein